MDSRDFRYCPFCSQLLLHPSEHSVDPPRCAKCDQGFYSAPHPTVAAVIVDESEEQVLLAQRKSAPFKDYWDIPGGFLLSEETLEEGLRREIFEELGIEIAIGRLLGSYPDTYGQAAVPTINVFYLASIARGIPSARSDVAEIRWFHRVRLPSKIAFECVRRALHAWRDEHSLGEKGMAAST